MTTAAWAFGLHLLTAHSAPGYETVTSGLYVRSPDGISAGKYRNSIGRRSFYLGQTFTTDDGRWSLLVGGVTGYKRECETQRWAALNGGVNTRPLCRGHASGKLAPLIVPSLRVGHVRLALVDFKHPAVHLALEF